ncbi:methyltransferase [Paraconexibacter sp. AEG42_29]|uniref:Methyltransferase n=1 Tax=Paraconexibacter sp. AEG42_29 TaxID=2997339 RepID=A0AAU7AWS9_9ACTN
MNALLPAARSRLYRAFSRLPYDRVQQTRRHPVVDRPLRACEALAGRGDVRISGGIAAGLHLFGPALPLRHVQAHGLVRGTLEPGVQEALRRHVSPGDVVCDVGANIGFFSLVLARLTGPDGRVHAFEPSPREAGACRRNAQVNGFEHVVVHQAAVGAAAGRAPFLLVDEHSWSHLADRGSHARAVATIDVDVVALDTLDWGASGPPRLIKLDVEGSERAALQGMSGLLADVRPVLVIELHETNHEVADLLEGHGYVLQNLDGPAAPRDAGPTHVVAWHPGP